MGEREQVSVIAEDDAHKIVLDSGSSFCRVGFAGADAPRSVFPACLSSLQPGIGDEKCSGDKNPPLECGIVTDWDAMERIWHHAFYEELRIDPEEYSVILSDHQLNPKFNREMMTEVMFEKFNVKGIIISTSSVLSLFANGRTSGVVVESGYGGTNVASVYEGSLLPNGLERVAFGGRDLTAYLVELLQKRGYSFATSSEWEYVNQMKESFCYVAYDFEEEQRNCEAGSVSEKHFTLPDGLKIKLKNERFRTCEVLFKPKLLFRPDLTEDETYLVNTSTSQLVRGHNNLLGVHEAVYNSIMQCDVNIRRDLFASSVLLSGGNTMFPNLQTRLMRELSKLFPPTAHIRVFAPPDRKTSVWIGGSIYASVADTWLLRKDYSEYGPTVVHQFVC